jgi:hypothetical protein
MFFEKESICEFTFKIALVKEIVLFNSKKQTSLSLNNSLKISISEHTIGLPIPPASSKAKGNPSENDDIT